MKVGTPIRILIVGHGIIGTIYGWALRTAGHEVIHFVRSGKSKELPREVTIDILDERKNHKKNNVTNYVVDYVEYVNRDQSFDYILVPTNSYQVIDATKTLFEQSPNSFFLIMSSNWEGTGEIDQILPKKQYALAYPDAGGTLRDGIFWTNLGAEIHIAAPDSENNQGVNGLIEVFKQADIKSDLQENMLHWLWLHNATTIPMWVAFFKYKDVNKFLKDKDLVKASFYATRELLELCQLRGVDVSKYPEVSAFRYPFRVFYFIFKMLFKFNKSMQRFTAHGATSVEESKANYKQMMKTARELEFNMPLMESIGAYLPS
ncbi:MAG: ketopantoate reductase family protein [Candidatus Thorarchaeota archaeon]